MLKEHDVVTVTTDVPEERLSAGDVGAIVHRYPENDVYEVDFVDEHGRARGVVTLSGSQLLRLNLSSLLTAS